MFLMQATPAQRLPGTDLITSFIARGPVVPGKAISPDSVDAVRDAFAAFVAEVTATGQGAYVRGFWQPASALGGPKRAPKGLKAAEAAGEFRKHVNV